MDGQYKLVGFFKKRTNYQFSFVVPAFRSDGKMFRSEIEPPSYLISEFSLNSQVVEELLPESLGSHTSFKKGDDAVYLYFFENKLYGGIRTIVADELTKIVKNYQLNPVDEYEIYMFLNVPEKIEESLEKLIESHKDIGLSKSNFYTPEVKMETSEDTAKISQYFKSGSQMLEVSRRVFDYMDFFKQNDPADKLVRINGGVFTREKLSEQFEALMEADQSDTYKDFIVQSFIYYKLDENLKEHPYFKLRKMIDLKPVDENFINHYQLLLHNSQSIRPIDNNVMEMCMKIEKNLPVPQKKTYSKSEEKDFQNTLVIAAKVKNGVV